MIDFKKLLEAIESSGVQKCLDLGFDEGFCINLTKWYAAFIALLSKLQDKAYEEAAKRLKKEEQVSSLLDDYFNRWTFTLDNGETVTVPYFMKTKDRINKRKKLPEVDNILHMAKIISQKWAADFKKSEFDCQSYNIGDDINLGKGSPEMIQYVVNQMLELYSIYSKSENTSEDYISSFKDFGFKKKTINSVMNVLSEKLNNAQQFMEDYGIGVDCSGFVSRALATIFEEIGVDKDVQIKSLGEASEKGCVRTNMSHFKLTDKNWERQKKKSKQFQNINVGDFFESKGHVKIVSFVERDEDNCIISYTTMESSPTTSSKSHHNAERIDNKNTNLSGLVKFKKLPTKNNMAPHLDENEGYMLFQTKALKEYYYPNNIITK